MSKATEPVARGHKKSIEFFGQVLITRVELAEKTPQMLVIHRIMVW